MPTKLENILTVVQNLPHLQPATSDTLGGIKADPVNENDTQDVHIGPDNKLYTAPSSSTADHRELSHRDADNQHPISAITGLQDELDGINSKIPAQASSTNQLADKTYVDNMVSNALGNIESLLSEI